MSVFCVLEVTPDKVVTMGVRDKYESVIRETCPRNLESCDGCIRTMNILDVFKIRNEVNALRLGLL